MNNSQPPPPKKESNFFLNELRDPSETGKAFQKQTQPSRLSLPKRYRNLCTRMDPVAMIESKLVAPQISKQFVVP